MGIIYKCSCQHATLNHSIREYTCKMVKISQICIIFVHWRFAMILFGDIRVLADLCVSLSNSSSQMKTDIQSKIYDSVHLYCFNTNKRFVIKFRNYSEKILAFSIRKFSVFSLDFERVSIDDSDSELMRKIDRNVPIKITTHGYNNENGSVYFLSIIFYIC